MTDMFASDDCQQCQHPFNPHMLIALYENPSLGGIMLCPEQGCRCYSTFGLSAERPLVALTQEEIDAFHESVWTGEMA